MQETPEHLLQVKNNLAKKEINNLWDFSNNLTFELAKITEEIAFFTAPKDKVLSYA
jgi:hypothetical protein